MHQVGRVDVGRVIDEGSWTAYQKWLIFLTALTIVFDGVDNQILGVAVPTLMREWSVPRSAFATATSLGYLGMMIGGAMAGLAGDRFGRRGALIGSMGLFGLMTLSIAAASSPGQLTILRFLAGLGLGGAMPNAAALAAEYVPRTRRPMAVTLTIVCVPLGAMAAGLLGTYVLPVTGWRMLFVCAGIVPMVAAFVMRRLLQESPRYLVRQRDRWPELAGVLTRMGHAVPPDASFIDSNEQVAASRASLGALFDSTFRRDTIALWAAFFSCLLAVYIGFAWLPALLTNAGLTPAAASQGITAFNLGGVVGALAGSVAMAYVGSRISMLVMAAGAATGAFVLSGTVITPEISPFQILAMLTITGGLINATQANMYALAAHVYPSLVRSTGVGSAVSFGRLGAVLSGYVGSLAIDLGGTSTYFGVMGTSMCVCVVALALVERHVAGFANASR